MRAFILTLGSRGDFELFLSLACALRRRGHEATLGTSGFYADRARAAGVACLPIGDGTRDEMLRLLHGLAGIPDRAQRIRGFFDGWIRPQFAPHLPRITDLAADAGYFVSNLKMVLDRAGVVIPGAIVAYDPPAALADLAMSGSRRAPDRVLELVAMSKPLVDPNAQWPAEYRFTGFWEPEPDPSLAPAADLAAFVAAGPPPVVVTMGSMVMFDAAALLRTVTDAVTMLGHRAVIVGGFAELDARPAESPAIHRTREVSYEWLFPRAACIVHHGGCGTVGAALRAGAPSILLPQITPQELFAGMLRREYLSAGAYDVRALDAASLAAAIDRAVRDARIAGSVAHWRSVVASEGGVDAAAAMIEAHAASLSRPGAHA